MYCNSVVNFPYNFLLLILFAALAAGLSDKLESLRSLETLVGFCGLAYQGRNDIDDIVPSSHRSSDLDGRKPNLVVSLFAREGLGRDDFNLWYTSNDNLLLTHWQRRIASSDVILSANKSVDYWLAKAEQLVDRLPIQLQPVAYGLVNSVKLKTVVKYQGWPG